MLDFIKRQVVQGLKKRGYILAQAKYYNPIPEKHTLGPSSGYWEKPYPCHGLSFDDPSYLRILKEFDAFKTEISSLPAKIFDPQQNLSFLDLDLEFLYSMVRLKKPRRIVEVGCGWSSMIIRRALEKNLKEGHVDRKSRSVIFNWTSGSLAFCPGEFLLSF